MMLLSRLVKLMHPCLKRVKINRHPVAPEPLAVVSKYIHYLQIMTFYNTMPK